MITVTFRYRQQVLDVYVHRVWDICGVPYDPADPDNDGGGVDAIASDRHVIRGYAVGATVETTAKGVAAQTAG